MTLSKIAFLCCVPVLYITNVSGEEPLVVGPGETLHLGVPEAGARLEAAIGGGPLKPVGQTMTAPANGDHWLAVASRDPVGNLSPIRWIRLRVDSEPPRVDLRTEPVPVHLERLWMPPSAAVTATAEDDLADISRLFLAVGDEVREVSERRLTVELPPRGGVTARAWTIDRAHNRSTEAKLDLAIDSTSPSGEIRVGCPAAVDGGAGMVVAPDCRIDVDVSDGESGVATWTLHVDGGEAPRETLDGPWAAGPHVVEVTALDNVGNQAHIGPFEFVADNAGPEITWQVSSEGVEGAAGQTFYRSPVELRVEAVDAPAGLDLLAASTARGSDQPIDGPIWAFGDSIQLRAVDRVGNRSQVEASWRLDLTPPEIFLETADGEAVARGTTLEIERHAAIRLRAVDHGVGVERATYSLAVESAAIFRRWWWWPPHDQPLPGQLTFPWPGELALKVQAIDRLGNQQTASWKIVVRPGRRL